MGKLIVLISLLISGCYIPPTRISRGIDQEMRHEVELFESFYGKKIEYPSVLFGELPFPQVGICTLYSNGNWEVTVDKVYWDSASKDARVGLIFHELGHCVLRRGHESQYIITTDNYQVPKSLMYPYNFYRKEFSGLWLYYSRELFNPSYKLVNNIDIKIIN